MAQGMLPLLVVLDCLFMHAVVPGACFLGTTNVLNIALAFGLSIFVLVYAAASFSGECLARLNMCIPIPGMQVA